MPHSLDSDSFALADSERDDGRCCCCCFIEDGTKAVVGTAQTKRQHATARQTGDSILLVVGVVEVEVFMIGMTDLCRNKTTTMWIFVPTKRTRMI